MEFNFDYEALKKNFKDITDKTVKKTGELTTIAKLNMTIKSEEAKLSDCYKSIGRLFYTAERDNLDNTEEIATYIMQADRIKATIADCQKELSVLRNVVVCEGCNNEISNDAIFCPICGLKVNKPAPVVEEEPIVEEETEEETCCDCGEETCCEDACTCDCEDASAEETPCTCGCDCENTEKAPADDTPIEE